MLQALHLDEEATYTDSSDSLFTTYAQRMFWVLFITERAYALQRNRPIRLQDTLKLPVIEPLSSDAEILLGFLDLISLFRPFNQDFISQWNLPTASTSTDFENLSKLQCLLKYALPNLSNHSQVQQADLLISRQWLKVVVWKLCASKRLLSGANSEDVMSLHYPASIAHDIVLVSQLVPTQAFEANGIGIVEKVFDVGCSLADLLSLVPLGSQGSTMDIGAIDTLMETVSNKTATVSKLWQVFSTIVIFDVNTTIRVNLWQFLVFQSRWPDKMPMNFSISAFNNACTVAFNGMFDRNRFNRDKCVVGEWRDTR
ncbi:transcription activator amyR [Fusarium austroafricanum]|uniref:Transcription activator amyR n=1 Tax=Fusarium austroafricanum TaxID=2364996 RepID=A0A8H4KEK1_9HYPO|nr:transcription activator amyR [Fusarium austroafricanum]